MSTFVLKIIALISMFFDHSGYVIFNGFSNFNYIGRLAFPIFAFLITEGYTHTKNFKKYCIRLFIWALISEAPFMLFKIKYVDANSPFSLNVLFTLLLGLFTIWSYDKNKTIGSFVLILSCYIAEMCKCDYGAFGIITIFIFYVFKDKKMLMNISFILLVLTRYIYKITIFFNTELFFPYFLLCLSTMFSLTFINLYNKKEGKKIKYLFYAFYPLHFLILYLIGNFLIK